MGPDEQIRCIGRAHPPDGWSRSQFSSCLVIILAGSGGADSGHPGPRLSPDRMWGARGTHDRLMRQTSCVTTPRSRRLTGSGVRLGFGVLVVALLLSACGQLDTTVAFNVLNDSTAPVIVDQCGNTCRQHHDVVHLRPGEFAPFNATEGGPSADFLVHAAGGEVVGCLSVLIRASRPSEPTIGVRSAATCSPHQLKAPSLWDRAFG